MKIFKKLRLAFAVALIAVCASGCATTTDKNTDNITDKNLTNIDLNVLTKPYINTYTCTKAMLGDVDLLKNCEYLRITFLNDKEIEITYKEKNGARHTNTYEYKFDHATSEFCADMSILGYTCVAPVKISDGKFEIATTILSKPLVMVFEVQ